MSPKPSILVVDDVDDGREMLTEYLAFRQFRVSEARNGKEAIAVARRVKPQIILMDLSMPVMDGWESTRQLRADARTKNAVIVALTAHAFSREHLAATSAGCDAVIAKPYDLTTLADALARVPTHGAKALDLMTSATARRKRRQARPSRR